MPVPVMGNNPKTRFLQICPENTIIWIAHDMQDADRLTLPSLLHDMMAYDPRGIGITQLALGDMRHLNSYKLGDLHPDELPPPLQQSLAKLLSSSLEAFYSVISPDCGARATLGIFTFRQAQFHHNRSVPLFSSAKSYTRLERDPRDIHMDLEHVGVYSDPRRNMFSWNKFKANFGEKRNIPVRYLLSIMPSMDEQAIVSRKAFVDYLQADDEAWEKWTGISNKNIWGDRMTEKEYMNQRTSLPQVAGLWNFPLEAFGDVPDAENVALMDPGAWQLKMLKNLSNYHPELWAFHLH
ncbi:hypothetical protein VHEMI08957 [[Torrubiella] hemipterigena]|uniref:Uncharacterized protein n=1 Tax=[Torrubiella] hemipterigena TaxID=1531966 RepID=A0A0A1TP54_9HYPO|nr:hypothetical protein VHEMI08957 [[Torrubiella] hemipterigena]